MLAEERTLLPSGAGRNRATVAAGFVSGMLAGPRSRGLDAGPLLEAAGVPGTILTDPGMRIPVAAYAALYNGLVRELDDEGFAMFSAPLRVGTFEFLCRGVVSSATLGEALERAARFLRVVLPDLRVRIERDRGAGRIVIEERRRLRPRTADPARVFAFEWLLRLLHALACWLAARPLALEAVEFPYPAPAHAADYALVYTEHASFGADALRAALQPALLDLPIRRDVRELDAFLADAPGKIALLYRRDREAARAVREIISGDFACGLDEAARRLHLAPRTLHRRLAEEGTSFRRIKEALRRDAALDRLEKTRLSVADIAAELGYSEPSAFFRAFLGWTGVAPTEHRRRRAVE